MALSSLGNNAALMGNMRQLQEGRPSPLAAIEEQRRRRFDEDLSEREARIAEYEAMTKSKNASTLAAKEERAASGETEIKKQMEAMNTLYAPTAPPGTPEYLRQKHAYASALSQSTNLDIADYGRQLTAQLENERKMTAPETQTAGGMQDAASLARTQAETRERSANADMAQAGRTHNMREASQQDQLWAKNILSQIDPGKQGNWWESATTPNLAPDETVALGQELAATLDQVRVQNPTIPEAQLRAMAVQQFKQSKGWDGNAPPPVTGADAAYAPQAPATAQATTPQPQVDPQFDFDSGF